MWHRRGRPARRCGRRLTTSSAVGQGERGSRDGRGGGSRPVGVGRPAVAVERSGVVGTCDGVGSRARVVGAGARCEAAAVGGAGPRRNASAVHRALDAVSWKGVGGSGRPPRPVRTSSSQGGDRCGAGGDGGANERFGDGLRSTAIGASRNGGWPARKPSRVRGKTDHGVHVENSAGQTLSGVWQRCR